MIFDKGDLDNLNTLTSETDEYIEKVMNSIGHNKENIIDKIDLLMMKRNDVFDKLNMCLEGDYEEKKLNYIKLVKLEEMINHLQLQLSMLKQKDKKEE